jgi:hypothetical protein
MISDGQGMVQLQAYDPATKTFIDLGWYDAASLAGQTVVKYDWSE